MRDLVLLSLSCGIAALIYALFVCRTRVLFFAALGTALCSALLSFFYLIADRFTGAGITESVFFHLLYGAKGLNIWQFKMEIALILSALALTIYLGVKAYSIFSDRVTQSGARNISTAIEATILTSLALFAVAAHPAVTQSAEIASALVESHDNRILTAALQQNPPSRESGAPKRSLVYIYAESMERTFFDPAVFPDLMPNMQKLERGALSIHGIRQAPLTEWTIAGMVASQCGIPLSTFRPNRNDLGDIANFIPGTTCLGDLLKAEGYQLAFIGGADLGFAGKGNFYQTHGFTETIGLTQIRNQLGHDIPVSKWGVYDDTLLDLAYQKFLDLSSGDQPFALVILTLDTHPPSGHVTPRCGSRITYSDGSNAMLNAIKCADHLIPEFVNRLELNNHRDALIVVASDHLQMKNDAIHLLESTGGARENLFLVRGRDIEPRTVHRRATTLDIAPTLLGLLGWRTDGLALGRNLLNDEPTLTEALGEAAFFDSVHRWRLGLWRTWSSDHSVN